jgi:hypothetical protein
MSKITYTIKQDLLGVDYIEGVIGDTILTIPMVAGNADYEAYLNKDKQQVEHLTEIPTPDEA